MKTGYFVIRGTEDGVRIDGPLPEAELLKRITPNPNEEGYTYYGKELEFSDVMPKDFNYCDSSLLVIIKGEIVVPKPKQVVNTYEIG